MKKGAEAVRPHPVWRLLFWSSAVPVAALLHYVIFVEGPRERAELMQRATAEIREEDRAFCEDFGFTGGSSQRTRCENGLEAIREKEAARLRAAELGLM